MEVLHFNRKELHRCYDLLKAGICLVKADAQGTILFANRGLVSMYDCASEEEFFLLRLAGSAVCIQVIRFSFQIRRRYSVFLFSQQSGICVQRMYG